MHKLVFWIYFAAFVSMPHSADATSGLYKLLKERGLWTCSRLARATFQPPSSGTVMLKNGPTSAQAAASLINSFTEQGAHFSANDISLLSFESLRDLPLVQWKQEKFLAHNGAGAEFLILDFGSGPISVWKERDQDDPTLGKRMLSAANVLGPSPRLVAQWRFATGNSQSPSISSEIVQGTFDEIQDDRLDRGLVNVIRKANEPVPSQIAYLELATASVIPDVVGAHGQVSMSTPGIVSLQVLSDSHMTTARELSKLYDFPVAARNVTPNGYHFWAIFYKGKNITREDLIGE